MHASVVVSWNQTMKAVPHCRQNPRFATKHKMYCTKQCCAVVLQYSSNFKTLEKHFN